jgi:hypothetical protein
VHVDVEADFDPANRPARIPSRDELGRHLRTLLGEDLPPFDRTVLHFLGNRVEAEVFLPPDVGGDPTRLASLERRLKDRLPDDPYFRAISLHCRIAPK